jgi:flagellar biosynthesis/type III secretory pathway protein FliH
MDSVRPFYLASFEKEGEAIVNQSRDLARDLTVSAAAEAIRLRDEARREGFEQGLAEGRAQGRQEEIRRMCASVESVIGAVERHRAKLETEAERDLVRLAVAIAEKIVKAEIAAGRPVAESNLRVAIRRASRQHGLEIRLNPSEAGPIETAAADFRRGLQVPGGAVFVSDPEVAPGGCVVRTAEGIVDLDVKSQLKEILRGLIGG